MDKLSKETVNALHQIAADRLASDVNDIGFEVDYEKEELRVIYGKFMPVVYRVNCAMDSVMGTVKDFAKQFIMQVEDQDVPKTLKIVYI